MAIRTIVQYWKTWTFLAEYTAQSDLAARSVVILRWIAVGTIEQEDKIVRWTHPRVMSITSIRLPRLTLEL